jgi:hypothetical protein
MHEMEQKYFFLINGLFSGPSDRESDEAPERDGRMERRPQHQHDHGQFAEAGYTCNTCKIDLVYGGRSYDRCT